jgi:hypothetical protein
MKRRCGRTWVTEPTTKNRAGEFVTNWASVGVVYMQFYGDRQETADMALATDTG